MSSAQLGVILQHLQRMRTVQSQSSATDGQLLEAFRLRRDETAFAELVRRHGPMVLNVCRGVLHNLHDAEDVFQATFLVLAQKAQCVRQPEAVGSWLCGVAYRLALKMMAEAQRRRRSEERTEERMTADPLLDMTLRELHQVLLEELQHLPEKYRLPLILCYLEGRTQTEASRQLGWDKEVLRGRLNRGRNQLRTRLERRGLTLSASVFVSALGGGTASALPAVCVEAAVKAALASTAGQEIGRFVTERAAALAEGAARTLFSCHGKFATILVLALGTLIAGAGLWARNPLPVREPGDTPIASFAPKPSPVKAQPEVTVEDQGDRLAVSGLVLDPDGKPFAGAAITVWWQDARGWICWHHPAMHAAKPYRGGTSGVDGRFRFSFDKSAIKDTYLTADARPWHRAAIVAAAAGYGPVWVHTLDLGNPNFKLQLVKDDVSIVGCVRDLQGQPVAGATVRLHRIEGGLERDAWEGPPAAVTTDEQGRFRLTGAGRDREAVLLVSGSRIESKVAHASTRKIVQGKPVKEATVEVIAGPTKPIEGTVRAKDTGKPLAGAWIYCNEHAFCNNHQVRLVRAVTDANGHYRLLGMPKSAEYKLTVYAPAGQSYLDSARTVADSEGLKPIVTDFSLRRGVPVKFRFLDKRTGQPVRGQIQYEVAQKNPLYGEAVYGPGVIPSREYMHIRTTDQDGYIRFVAYPGPGVIYGFAGRESGHFLPSKLDPADQAKGYLPLGKGDPANGFLALSQGYRRIDFPENAKEQTFDIVFDPGRTVKGSLVDADGRPVRGATAWGLMLGRNALGAIREGEQVLKTEAFTATGIDRHQPCTLSFIHRERKLIGQVAVRPEDKSPLTVRLQPWGTLTGRLIDAEGKPLAHVKIHLEYPNSPGTGVRPPDQEFSTDRDGRFHVEGLLPGLKHELILGGDSPKVRSVPVGREYLNELARRSGGKRLQGLSAQAGKVKELGDIRVIQGNP